MIPFETGGPGGKRRERCPFGFVRVQHGIHRGVRAQFVILSYLHFHFLSRPSLKMLRPRVLPKAEATRYLG